jgi:hypothetical protein
MKTKLPTRSHKATKFFLRIQNPFFDLWTSKLSLWLCGFVLILVPVWAFAQTPTPASQTPKLAQAAQQVQKAQEVVQKTKDAWDRSRLEATLYSQRADRAYRRWAAAKKDWKKKMAEHKDEAQLEFQVAVEKRKLSYDLWQQALDRLNAQQQLLNAEEVAEDIEATKAQLFKLESKLTPSLSPTPGA